MAELRDLLERATDGIEPRGGAAEALRVARRSRTRQRGTAAALVAATTVAAVVVGVRLATGGTGESAPPPAESPTATPTVAPSVDPGRVQPVWDPRGAEGLPVTDLGLPRVMPSEPAGSMDRPPVAVLDEGTRLLAVAADGSAVAFDPPDGIGRDRALLLAPDGARVAVVGAEGSLWRPVSSPTWRPGSGGIGGGLSVGEVPGLERPVADRDWIAGTWSSAPARGLVVLDRRTLQARAVLPVQVAPHDLTVVAWVDDDTVAFTVQPPGAPKEYLVTWNVETGELSRISCWLTSFQASFATDLLG